MIILLGAKLSQRNLIIGIRINGAMGHIVPLLSITTGAIMVL